MWTHLKSRGNHKNFVQIKLQAEQQENIAEENNFRL